MSRALLSRGQASALVCAAVLSLCGSSDAYAYDDVGHAIEAESETVLRVDGYFRTRFSLLNNLDLDRGETPSGQLLFPVPLGDPTGQTLTHADVRLRTDLHLFVPKASMAFHVRIDAFDNFTLGSQPDGVPSVAVSQRDLDDPIRIKQAWAEVLTPFGLFAVGRMGNQWGLGMLANSGDCARCDAGDAADRVLFSTPLLGHIWTVAYDFTAVGPTTPRNAPRRAIDLDPWDDVRTLTVAMLDVRSDVARRRRARAGRMSFEYGAYVSHRRQNQDVPAHYLPIASPVPLDRAQVITRDFRATALDFWSRLTLPNGRLELEAAFITARIGQPSLLPGALLRHQFTSNQFGAAFESEFGPALSAHPHQVRWAVGFDAGFASGDSAPGFGALLGARNQGPNAAAPVAGDIDGPQALAPFDTTVDNFRFHSDYRVDRILFRELIGTVTDAFYLRPHGRIRLADVGPGRLELSLAAIASFAVQAPSTPSGERPLGVELDPSLSYTTTGGFAAVVDYAALFPLSGLDNPAAGLAARPAQLLRFRLMMNY